MRCGCSQANLFVSHLKEKCEMSKAADILRLVQ